MRIDEELMEIWPNEVCDSHVLLGLRVGPPADLRSSGRGLFSLVALEKWKISDLLCSMASPKSLKREKIML